MMIYMIPAFVAVIAMTLAPLLWAMKQQHRHGEFAGAEVHERLATGLAFEGAPEDSSEAEAEAA